jgi:hypothetical protein
MLIRGSWCVKAVKAVKVVAELRHVVGCGIGFGGVWRDVRSRRVFYFATNPRPLLNGLGANTDWYLRS